MSRVFDQPITVNLNESGNIADFTWRNRRHTVTALLEEWRDTGCWWDGESEKAFYRLCTTDGEYELYRDLDVDAWRLYRVID